MHLSAVGSSRPEGMNRFNSAASSWQHCVKSTIAELHFAQACIGFCQFAAWRWLLEQ
jgi:hypothetical protein